MEFDKKKHTTVLGNLIGKIRNKRRAQRMLKIFYKEKILDRYLQTPASPKYHDCYPGGLLVHSIFVTLKMLADKKLYPRTVNSDKIITVGLLHDLGKIGTKTEHFYLPAEGSKIYYHNEKISRIPHAARSLFTLQELRLQLEEDEFQAILYHNGMYTESGTDIKNNEYPLTLLLHHADMYVSHVLENMGREEQEITKSKLIRKVV